MIPLRPIRRTEGSPVRGRRVRTLPAFIVVLALLGVVGRSSRADEAQSRLDVLVADLGHDDFDRREAATRALITLGDKALPAVKAAFDSPDPEVTARGYRIVETWFVEGDPATAGVAADLIDELRISKNPALAARARQIFTSYAEVVVTRAVERIRALGGECEPSRSSFNVIRPNMRFDAQFKDVLLGEDWKGGTEGLKYLRRIGGISILYVTPGSGLTPEVVDTVSRDLNGVAVQWRGNGMLGIQRQQSEELGVMIDEVRPGGPAQLAGVESGDMVVLYQGEEIKQFQKIIDLTQSLSSSSVVELVVLRDDELLTFRFPLQKFSIAPPPVQNQEPRLRIR